MFSEATTQGTTTTRRRDDVGIPSAVSRRRVVAVFPAGTSRDPIKGRHSLPPTDALTGPSSSHPSAEPRASTATPVWGIEAGRLSVCVRDHTLLASGPAASWQSSPTPLDPTRGRHSSRQTDVFTQQTLARRACPARGRRSLLQTDALAQQRWPHPSSRSSKVTVPGPSSGPPVAPSRPSATSRLPARGRHSLPQTDVLTRFPGVLATHRPRLGGSGGAPPSSKSMTTPGALRARAPEAGGAS